jgi:hypothetical protein
MYKRIKIIFCLLYESEHHNFTKLIILEIYSVMFMIMNSLLLKYKLCCNILYMTQWKREQDLVRNIIKRRKGFIPYSDM